MASQDAPTDLSKFTNDMYYFFFWLKKIRVCTLF